MYIGRSTIRPIDITNAIKFSNIYNYFNHLIDVFRTLMQTAIKTINRSYTHKNYSRKEITPLNNTSDQISRSVVSDSLQPPESQHARLPCPSPTPRVHWDSRPSISDAIQPSHPLWSPSPPAPNPSQQQGLFQWINSSHEVAKVHTFS